MANIINIETSTTVCSAALCTDGKAIATKEDRQGMNHSTVLAPFVKELTDVAKDKGLKIDAVAVSCGPGSYTGLRIGVSMAKGLCYGLNAKLIAVNTLQLMANSVAHLPEIANDANALLCPMIDARRMEVYTAFFTNKLGTFRPTEAAIITPESYADILARHKVYCFGNGSDKCHDTLKSPNLIYLADVVPLASSMATLSQLAFDNSKFEDVAYFEPFYLKEFVAVKSQNKLF